MMTFEACSLECFAAGRASFKELDTSSAEADPFPYSVAPHHLKAAQAGTNCQARRTFISAQAVSNPAELQYSLEQPRRQIGRGQRVLQALVYQMAEVARRAAKQA